MLSTILLSKKKRNKMISIKQSDKIKELLNYAKHI